MGEDEVVRNLAKLNILNANIQIFFDEDLEKITDFMVDFYKMGKSEGMKSVVNEVNG